MIRAVVTGSECTGKTTLASRLASRFGTLWVPEHAREYANHANRELTYADVEPIARGQVETEQRIAASAGDLLILDTDILSTVVYSHHYYGRCPDWVEDALRQRLPDLYLLLYPDVPWIADGIRDRGHLRSEMHALFKAALERFEATYIEIRGDWSQREEAAIAAIGAMQGGLFSRNRH